MAWRDREEKGEGERQRGRIYIYERTITIFGRKREIKINPQTQIDSNNSPNKNTVCDTFNVKGSQGSVAALTMSGFSRAKMAKVDSLSHTHLVLNESTSTALQPLADQDPSREELHEDKHTHTQRKAMQ